MNGAAARLIIEPINPNPTEPSDPMPDPHPALLPSSSSRLRPGGLVLKRGTVPLLVVGLLTLAGCTSVKTQVDTGPLVGHTFAFMNPGPQGVPAYAENRELAHTLIQQAITTNLAAKGLRRVPQDGDLTVAYLVIVGNNVATTSLNEYFGYGPEADAWLEKVHKGQTVKDKDRAYFESGTLVIDFVDRKTAKLLERASIQAEILRNLPMESRVARLQAIVDQALSNVRVAH